jgi:GT2 family glycosyltransferase
MMLASVILCTYNRARLLGRALRSLARQTAAADEFEVVVVDDGSTDGTAEICSRASRDMSNLRYVAMGRNLGLAAAANSGIRSARGRLLLFTDDDCIAQEDWAKQLAASLVQYPITTGAIQSPVSNYIKFCHNISQFHPFLNRRTEGWARSIAGGNMGIRRSLLEDLGGFDETSQVPDMEFWLRAWSRGQRVRFVPRAVIIHDPDRTSLAAVLRIASEHASKTILLRNRFGALLQTPFVLRSPELILLAAPLIALTGTLRIYRYNPALVPYFWTAPLVYAQKLAWCWGASQGLRRQPSAGLPAGRPEAIPGWSEKSSLGV